MQEPLREQLADCQHEIWSHWMKYLFSCCPANEDGSVTIPSDKVERWKRQLETKYTELPDKERESDRHQADKILAVMVSANEDPMSSLMKQIAIEIDLKHKNDPTFYEENYIKLRLQGIAAKDIPYEKCHWP